MIFYESAEQLANALKLRIRIFNTKTGQNIPDINPFPIPNSREGLLRLRKDIDSLVNEYDVINPDSCSVDFYLTTRYKIELLSDFIDNR